MKAYNVKSAYLQSSVLIPGTTLANETTLVKERHSGLKMTYTADGLHVEQRGFKGIIPLANVRNVVLENQANEGKDD